MEPHLPISRPRLLRLACLVAILHAGCAHTVGQMARAAAVSATPEVIQASLEAVDTDATRKLLLDILRNPDVQKAAQLLVARLTDGALDALSKPERADRITQFADAFLARIVAAIEHSFQTTLGPAVVQLVGQALDEALVRAMSPENQQHLADTVAVVLERSVTVLAKSLDAPLHQALRGALREDLGPALRDGLRDPATQAALGATLRTMTKEAMLGMQDAFVEIDKRDTAGNGPPTLLSRLQRLAVEGSQFARYLALGLGLLVVLLAVWLYRTRTHVAHVTRESGRREAALQALGQALKSAEDRPWSHELREVLETALREDVKAEYLREVWVNGKAAPAPQARRGEEETRRVLKNLQHL